MTTLTSSASQTCDIDLDVSTIFAIKNILDLFDGRPFAATYAWRSRMQESLHRFKAGVFQALAHPTRIAIVELLRDEKEVPVSRIYERLDLEQANASQHLAVLRSKQIVAWRKEGNQVFYSLRDPRLGKILDLMR